ncbi:MAG: hypothetical protein FJ087_00990, partial [Deltaproteobacteria bacterium]|nr:hypothetical protein [Deltaproteobacteria bacterium]
MRRNLFAILAAVALALPAIAAAQPGPGGRGGGYGYGHGKGGMGPGMHGGPGVHLRHVYKCLMNSPEIALDADQKKQVDAIRDELKAGLKGRKNEMRARHQEFMKAFSDASKSNADLKKMADAMHADMKAQMDAKWDTVMKVRQVP